MSYSARGLHSSFSFSEKTQTEIIIMRMGEWLEQHASQFSVIIILRLKTAGHAARAIKRRLISSENLSEFVRRRLVTWQCRWPVTVSNAHVSQQHWWRGYHNSINHISHVNHQSSYLQSSVDVWDRHGQETVNIVNGSILCSSASKLQNYGVSPGTTSILVTVVIISWSEYAPWNTYHKTTSILSCNTEVSVSTHIQGLYSSIIYWEWS